MLQLVHMLRWLLWWYLQVCNQIFSKIKDSLQSKWPRYLQLCYKSLYSYEKNEHVRCSFFKEIATLCGKTNDFWSKWTTVTKCGRWFLSLSDQLLKINSSLKKWITLTQLIFPSVMSRCNCLSLWLPAAKPTCPGDLVYNEEGTAFLPSCSNPKSQLTSQDITGSCVCPEGEYWIGELIYVAL